MLKQQQQGTVLASELVKAFQKNQEQIAEKVKKINELGESTIDEVKKARISEFRGQVLAIDLENQEARLNMLDEFLKEVTC